MVTPNYSHGFLSKLKAMKASEYERDKERNPEGGRHRVTFKPMYKDADGNSVYWNGKISKNLDDVKTTNQNDAAVFSHYFLMKHALKHAGLKDVFTRDDMGYFFGGDYNDVDKYTFKTKK